MSPASLALGLLLLAGPASAATVLSVGDGDTLRVVEGSQRLTIRLACIDAPVAAQNPYGAAARQHLQRLAPVGAVVTLRPQTKDRYGRTVAEVLRNGQSVNLAMVRDGQAFAYRKYLQVCNGSAYLGAEASAQRQPRGVWAVPGGITRPWVFRRGGGPASTSSTGSAPLLAGRRYRCRDIGSYGRGQELLRQGHTYLDANEDGQACESLR
jgi:endonuclease YncB( thermonuclease family)